MQKHIDRLTSTNPMTGEMLWEGVCSTKAEVDASVIRARKAFPEWSAFPLEKRVDFLKKYQDILNSQKHTFAETISMETGKPLWESKNEVETMIAKVDISIAAQNIRCQERIKELPTGISVTRHKPLGVVAVFGPFNFPGHLPNGHIVPALLAGNTVVFKPSELTPWVAEEMVRLWEQSGLPSGVLNLVQGGPLVGKSLSNHPDIDALLFTGSWNTGKILAEQFGSHPEKLLALEMGGNNPLIIGDISNLKAAAYITIQSAYLTSGQRCTCARRLIVPRGKLGDSFIQEVLNAIPNIKVGAYTEKPEPFMGPVITQQAAQHLLSAQETLIQKGGIPLAKMKLLKPNTPLLSPGLIDVTDIANLPDEEHFGPLLQVIRVPDFAAAIEEANNTAYGLCAAILSEERKQYEEYYSKARTGVVNWNAQTTGATSASPFGGLGHSGNYRPSAFYAADFCNYPIASMEVGELTMPSTLSPGIKT
ncbi:MAG: N-succinylglutamate 5-semialdehyde dehydrogenase [Chlamydiae bacterium]|nr:N-succinylglutamate 5-semialdehyde dehydrogenase [Chlamydiota bacterium]